MPGESLQGKWNGSKSASADRPGPGLCTGKVRKRLERRRGLGRSSNKKREAPGNLPNSEYKIINR